MDDGLWKPPGGRLRVVETRIQRVKVNRLRGIRPGTRLVFADGPTLVLGKNGTGKTCLTHLLACIATGRFDEFDSEAIDVEYVTQLGFVEIKTHVVLQGSEETGEEFPPFSIDAVATLPDGTHLEFQLRRDGRQMLFNGGVVEDFDAPPMAPAETLICLMQHLNSKNMIDPEVALGSENRGQLHAAASRLQNSGRFPEGNYPFDILRGTNWKSGSSIAPVWVSFYRLSDGGYRCRNANSMTPEVAEHLASQLDDGNLILKMPRQLLPRTDAFLRSLSLGEYTLALRRDTELKRRSSDVVFKRLDGLFEAETGMLPLSALSYGQKRRFALCFHLDSAPAVLIADELSDGFHREWLRGLLESLDGIQQAFVTSQNPLLVDTLWFEHREDFLKRVIICERAGGGVRDWRRPTETEADRFWEAYSSGYSHVSEIMFDMDLW